MKSQDTHKLRGPRVFVGMSGGVDSSVSAALLKDAGYDVTGVFIKVWQPDWIECTWKDERREAMRAAAHLGIPFVTLDLVQEYKIEVIDYMIAEYRAGRTPNPDVMCNREVKFGAFWRWAEKQGADFVATGHYARIIEEQPTPTFDEGHFASRSDGENSARLARRDARPEENVGVGSFKLLAGVDTNKDQSYFLWTLNANDLKHILFPVGHLTKPEVRVLARKYKLPNADKKDSQGLCFIGKVDIKDFLSRYIDTKPGMVLNEMREVIGSHTGSLLLTIGERHGFTITKKTPHDAPYYVISKDTVKNTVTVANHSRLADNTIHTKQQVTLVRVNWVSTIPAKGDALQARTRYRQELQNIKILSADSELATIEFQTAQETITPGQSLVIYSKDETIGGGIIE